MKMTIGKKSIAGTKLYLILLSNDRNVNITKDMFLCEKGERMEVTSTNKNKRGRIFLEYHVMYTISYVLYR